MSYTKQNFTTGQILKASHLNYMESGISDNADAIATNASNIEQLNSNIENLSGYILYNGDKTTSVNITNMSDYRKFDIGITGKDYNYVQFFSIYPDISITNEFNCTLTYRPYEDMIQITTGIICIDKENNRLYIKDLGCVVNLNMSGKTISWGGDNFINTRIVMVIGFK